MWSQANATTLLVLALVGGIVWPQNVWPQSVVKAGGRPQPRDVLEKLDFEGGTLLDYVEKVKASLPGGECNLVINRRDWASEVSMPPVSLTMVSVDTALKLIEFLVEGEEYRCRLHSHNKGEVFILRIEKSRRERKKTEPSPAPRRLEVFSLASGAELSPGSPRIESLLTAVDDALRLQSRSDKDKAKIRFHPDSGLLLVFGTGEETRIVNEIVQRLSGDLKQKMELKDLRAEREELLGRVESLTVQLEQWKEARAALEVKMRALDEERAVRQNDTEKLRVHLRKLMVENQQLKLELAALKEKSKSSQEP